VRRWGARLSGRTQRARPCPQPVPTLPPAAPPRPARLRPPKHKTQLLNVCNANIKDGLLSSSTAKKCIKRKTDTWWAGRVGFVTTHLGGWVLERVNES
jgi:hypothetical protein